MKLRDTKSIIIIFVYLVLNGLIVTASLKVKNDLETSKKSAQSLAPEFTRILKLEYFHLKDAQPALSLSAAEMISEGEDLAQFVSPQGIYHFSQKKKSLQYDAQEGTYRKVKNILGLKGEVRLKSEDATYLADKVSYLFKKDLVIAKGNVSFAGEDPKSKDHVTVKADSMRSKPAAQLTSFKGNVSGTMQRKKKYEGKLSFWSGAMNLDGDKSLALLEGGVRIVRDNYDITSGKAEMFLENYNKSLKYFVLNDDVKVSEKVEGPQGSQTRRAYAERLEGFGREQKMVLTGAPRVEMGKDVIKGYRITIRENVDLLEIDDAMSDVQVKREKLKD